MGRHAKPKDETSAPDASDYIDLLDFWREVMRGRMTTVVDGKLSDGYIPMELRLKASELLAKYTEKTKIGKPKGVADVATATPDVIKLAKMLEQTASLSDDELEQALNLVTEGDDEHG